MKKKRYLVENDYITGGGAENVMRNLVTLLLDEGHDVTIATWKGSKKTFYEIYPDTVHHFMVEFPWNDQVKRFTIQWALQRIRYMLFCIQGYILKHRLFDVAIAMKEGPCMADVVERRAKKHIGWVHVDYRHLYWTDCVFPSAEEEKKCFQKMDKVVCVSQTAADGVIQTIGDPGNLKVCYNPLNVAHIRGLAQCNPVRKPGKPVFVAVGRLCVEKRYTMMLRVCNRLSTKYNFELWILGDGPQREELENSILAQRMNGVKFLGHQSNPYPYMKAADCFISTSKTESYGLAVQESLILGVPVLVTKCAAMIETVPQQFGIIVEDDEDAVYEAWEKLLMKPSILVEYRKVLENEKVYDTLYEDRIEAIRHVVEDDCN